MTTLDAIPVVFTWHDAGHWWFTEDADMAQRKRDAGFTVTRLESLPPQPVEVTEALLNFIHIEPMKGRHGETIPAMVLGDRDASYKFPAANSYEEAYFNQLGVYLEAARRPSGDAIRTGRAEVKPLVWNGGFAHTGLGLFYHLIDSGGAAGAILERHEGSATIKSFFASGEEAKAAAQSDYSIRILSALKPLLRALIVPQEAVK